jgi:hypothetical protein
MQSYEDECRVVGRHVQCHINQPPALDHHAACINRDGNELVMIFTLVTDLT